MSKSPSRRATEAMTEKESSVAPYGTVDVGKNGVSLTLTIPKEVVEGLGIEQGDSMAVGLDMATGELRYKPVEQFDGW